MQTHIIMEKATETKEKEIESKVGMMKGENKEGKRWYYNYFIWDVLNSKYLVLGISKLLFEKFKTNHL